MSSCSSPGSPSLFLVQKDHEHNDPCPIQEGSSQYSRVDGNADGKVSFRDGVGGGVEKGDETGIEQEDQYHQEGLVRNPSLLYQTPLLTCTQALVRISASTIQVSRPYLRLPEAERAQAQRPPLIAVDEDPEGVC
jgi:hypothetical protein